MIIKKAYAKINLFLKIKGLRKDGYHDIESLIAPIDLHDVLTFEETSDDLITLNCNIEIENNVVLLVAKYMKETYNKGGVQIKLTKNIPISSGLGGESADAAATINGLNDLWGLNLGDKEKENIAFLFGSDIVFCLYNKPALVKNRGSIESFVHVPNHRVILYITDIELRTKMMFNEYDNLEKLSIYDNDFLSVIERQHDDVFCIYNVLRKYYRNVYMSGSGPTFFILDEVEQEIPIRFKSILTTFVL